MWETFAEALAEVVGYERRIEMVLGDRSVGRVPEKRTFKDVCRGVSFLVEGGCRVVRKSDGWVIKSDEADIRKRRCFLQGCLIGRLLRVSLSIQELQREVEQIWSTNVRVAEFGDDSWLFEFQSTSEAERVVSSGWWKVREGNLLLECWSLTAGCNGRKSKRSFHWLCIVGIPLH